jgi:hypothetical protein
MPEPLPPITRPNGKLYRPRMIKAAAWDDTSGDLGGVFVLGTHDIERARPLAVRAIQAWHDSSMTAVRPELRWVRSGIANGEPTWLDDPVRGRAAVEWTADYPEEPHDVH